MALKLSIITITRNSERYLRETIESVISQDYPDFEYILVDGESTDGTLDIIKGYAAGDGRVRWISEPDRGIADAMNKGIRLATGDVVAHIHSDDLYLPDVFSRVAGIFRENPRARWVTGRLRYIDGEGRVLYDTTLKTSYAFRSIFKRNIIGHPATFIRRDVFAEAGLFDTALRYAMDYDLWLRISSRYEPLAVNDLFAKFRQHRDSLSSREILKAIDEEFAVKKRYREISGRLPLYGAWFVREKNRLLIRLGLHNTIKRLRQKMAS